MVQSKATVTIDLGNSETRVRVSLRQGNDKKPIKRMFVLSNRFATISESYVPTSDYSPETSTIMVMDEDIERGIVAGSHIVNGELAVKEYYDALEKPTAMEKKCTSRYTKYSVQLAMLFAHRALMSIVRATSLDSLDVSWDVVVLLPPGDLDAGKPVIEEMLRNMPELKFKYPNITLPFKVDRVGVFAEGFCSYVGAVFEDDFSVRKGYEDVAEDTTIVFDIGAGTTDVLIIQDGKPIRKTLYTIELGGNQVTARVRLHAKQRLNARISETEVQDAMKTGYLKSGSTRVDISDIIRTEKETFARNIVSEIKEFFEATLFPTNVIGKALVCGGGAIDSDLPDVAEKVGSMAGGIVEFMKKLSPNIQLVPLPVIEMITFNEDGTPEKTVGTASPRDLNLIGGSILADM